ncbi:MAG: LysE family transporter [Rhizobiaceae bacterium]|nr:LysE family transporter [Rhizobiaceae bacterium]
MLGEDGLSAGIWQALATLLLASLVIMGSPGPSTISATAVGAAYGFRRSLGYVGGLVAGTVVVLLTVAVGIVAFLMSVPHGASVLIAVSVVYILYLSFKIATAPPLAERGEAATPAFTGGFLLAIANPKAYLAIAAVFAGTSLFRQAPVLDAAIKTVLLGAMIVLIHVCWLLAGASLSRFLQNPTISRVVNVGLAAILVISTAVALFG